jgi:hypothetical protein
MKKLLSLILITMFFACSGSIDVNLGDNDDNDDGGNETNPSRNGFYNKVDDLQYMKTSEDDLTQIEDLVEGIEDCTIDPIAESYQDLSVKISDDTFTFYFFEILEYLNMPPTSLDDFVIGQKCKITIPIVSNQINMGDYGVLDLITDGDNLSIAEAGSGFYPDDAFYKITSGSFIGTYTSFEDEDVTVFLNSLPDCTWEEGDGGCMDLGTCPFGKFIKSHAEGNFDIFWVDSEDHPTVGCITSWHDFGKPFNWADPEYIGEYYEELNEITISPLE